jgi:HEPN domain-containing protein
MNEIINNVNAWTTKADHDLGSAKLIYLHIPDYYDSIAFHCQQAVEKYIKSALVYFKIEFRHSHDLIYLLELLSQKIKITDDTFDKAIKLNGFSVEIRYPNIIENLSNEKLEEAIEISEYFRNFILDIIKIIG